ncbi:hypothetical protein PanWU01x14_362190, partial [Parasponia andersonii]
MPSTPTKQNKSLSPQIQRLTFHNPKIPPLPLGTQLSLAPLPLTPLDKKPRKPHCHCQYSTSIS